MDAADPHHYATVGSASAEKGPCQEALQAVEEGIRTPFSFEGATVGSALNSSASLSRHRPKTERNEATIAIANGLVEGRGYFMILPRIFGTTS